MGFHHCYDNANIKQTKWMISELEQHVSNLLYEARAKRERNKERQEKRDAGENDVSDDESLSEDDDYLSEDSDESDESDEYICRILESIMHDFESTIDQRVDKYISEPFKVDTTCGLELYVNSMYNENEALEISLKDKLFPYGIWVRQYTSGNIRFYAEKRPDAECTGPIADALNKLFYHLESEGIDITKHVT